MNQYKKICLMASLAACAHVSDALELSVSNQPDGSAKFQSLEKARDAIRAMKADGRFPKQGVTVNIRGGTYPVHSTFELGPNDAGLPGSPVVYRARDGESVVLSGGQTIPFEKFVPVIDPETLDWLVPEARDKILFVDLFSLGIRNLGEIKQQGFSTPILPAHMEVYANDKAFELAKWPNEGSLKVGKVLDSGAKPYDELHGGTFQDPALINSNYVTRGGTFGFDYDRADRWAKASNIWLQGVFSRGFAHDNLKVKKLDLDQRTITTEQPHMFGIEPWLNVNPMTKSRHYVVYNLLEELDQPGEYFIDKQAGRLYLIPFEGETPESISVTIFEKPFIAIENTANLRIEGLTLEYGRGLGIYMENSENVVLDQLTVRGFGTLGIMMGQGVEGGPEGPVHEFTGTPVSRHVGNIKAHHYENSTWNRKAGRNCIIQNSTIYNTGQGGVIIDGGSRIDLSGGNNRIENCELFQNSNLRKSYSPAVSVYGVGNAVENCRIHHQPHNAITIFGNDHVIGFNEIDHILQGEFEDMGAFYMGRNPSEMGNKIICNYFHDINADENRRVTGVYFDDGSGGSVVASNLFYKVGSPKFGAILFHFGQRNTVENNVFIDCPAAAKFAVNTSRWENRRVSTLWKKRLFEDIDINQPPYSTRYPLLQGYLEVSSRINFARNNLLINCEKSFEAYGGKIGLDADGDFLTNGNRNVTLELTSDSFTPAMLNDPAFTRLTDGMDPFGKIPVDRIGLSKEVQKNPAPEAGSFVEKNVVGVWAITPDEHLPNVLLLGDSISIGYTLPVRKQLKGKANFFRPHWPNGERPVNCCGTTRTLEGMDQWLAGRKWDVIHFNFGLHDLKHVDAKTGLNSELPEDPVQADVEQYRKNLEVIVRKLKATGAHLIFATTTPVAPGTGKPLREPDAPARYNATALEIMNAQDIQVNDLYALCESRLEELQLPQNVHFNPRGNQILAEQVAEVIQKALVEIEKEEKNDE